MKQVVQSARSGKLSLRDVPEPQVKAGSLLVKTQASLISAGTERMMVQFAKKSMLGKAQARPDLVKKVLNKAQRDGIVATMQAVMARLDEPLPLGYSAVGKVVAVGHGLEGFFQTDQRVAVAGAGLANHAELNVIPQNLAVPVPDDVSDEEACFATLGSIALHGVRCLGAELGDVVGVVGTGLVGQLVLQFLTLSGCRVIAFDYDAKRLELASRMGAEMVWDLAEGSPVEAVMTLTRGIGCDSVLIAAATDSSAPFETAAEIARDRARVSLVGITGTAFPYREFMKKELSIVVSRSYGPGRYDEDYEGKGIKYPPGYVRWTETENMAECVRLMSPARRHRLEIKPLITHRFEFSRAEEAYQMVTQGTEPHLGVVLFYKESDEVPASPQRVSSRSTSSEHLATGQCVLGAIGAGNFARMMILPLLKKMSGCTLHSIATRRGISAEHSQKAFGFQYAGTDVEEIFNNPDINAVLITTPHSSHANLTARALEAGKHVLVEKPLALDMAQLNQVITARNDANRFFQVGFNRRFAPLTQKVRQHLAKYSGEKSVLLRVNAGQLPPESWQNDPEEGQGRILGEVCHFIDLARYFVGSAIKSVRATATTISHGACDDLTVILSFLDGSLATIVYTAMGDSAFSKERFECYVGGTVATIEDFRTMTVVVDGKPKTTNLHAQDKGHKAELEAFVNAVRNGEPAPIDEQELIESSHATIAVLDALKTGNVIKL